MSSITTGPRRRRTTFVASSVALLAAVAVITGPDSRASAAPQRPSQPAQPPQPDVVALAGPLADQEVTWRQCAVGTPPRPLAIPDLSCATVTVPRDWDDPRDGRTWSLEVSQLTNLERTDPAYRGTIVGNPGGPGQSGLLMPIILDSRAPRLSSSYNFVGFEPRGTGPGSAAVCTVKVDPGATDPAARAKSIADGCSNHPDVRTINSRQTAYDMDLIRHLIDLRRLDYIGYSYGTWLGSTYQRLFPRNAGRFLLDSAVDVTAPSLQRTFEDQAVARDRQFEYRLTGYLARQDARYGLGTDRTAIYRRYLAAREVISPEAFALAWTKPGALGAFANNRDYPEMATAATAVITTAESAGAADLPTDPASVAAVLLRNAAALPSAARTSTRADLLAAARTLDSVAALPDPGTAAMEVQTNLPFEFIRCNDGQWTQGLDYWQGRVDRARTETPLSWDFGAVRVPPCAWWRASYRPTPIPRTYPAAARTMVVHSELDSQTGYEGGLATGTRLPNARAVFIDNEGSHALFPYGTDCVDEPVYTFFETGRLPRRDVTVCQGRPLVNETTTYETWTRLSPRGAPTREVESAFVEARTPRPTGPRRTDTPSLEDPVVTQARSLLAFDVLARYGERGLRLMDLDTSGVGTPTD